MDLILIDNIITYSFFVILLLLSAGYVYAKSEQIMNGDNTFIDDKHENKE